MNAQGAMQEILRVTRDDLLEVSRNALIAVGLDDVAARDASDILVLADLMGIETHGTSRLAVYTQRLKSGSFRPGAQVEVTEKSAAMALVDGGGALGAIVGQAGLRASIKLAKQSGIGIAACRNSNHFGALAPYAFLASQQGMICILGTTATTTIAPWGGREVKVGNNPFGFGAPRPDAFPFILDMAISTAARSKIRNARDAGQSIPEGWALDADGQSTTDPVKALQGFLMPIGGHKGSGLALAVDLLCGVATGGKFLSQIGTWVEDTGIPQGLGHFFIMIDPDRLIGREAYDLQMERFCDIVHTTPPVAEDHPVMLPGELEGRAYEDRIVNGVPMQVTDWESLCQLPDAK